MIKKSCKVLFIILVLLFLYFPVILLAVYSFTDSTAIGAIRGFSLHNYRTLVTVPELRNMILGTLLLALVAAFIATLLGSAGALGSFYSSRKTRNVISVINSIPVINADVVTGFSICVLLVVVMHISKETFIPLIMGHVTLCAPFVYLNVMPRIRQMDPGLYEAALDLGATPAGALRQVVLPEIIPGILSGFGLSVTLSLDDYFITTYTKPASFDTISTYVVNATRGAQTEIKTALWALGTVIFAVVILVVLFANLKNTQGKEGKEQGDV